MTPLLLLLLLLPPPTLAFPISQTISLNGTPLPFTLASPDASPDDLAAALAAEHGLPHKTTLALRDIITVTLEEALVDAGEPFPPSLQPVYSPFVRGLNLAEIPLVTAGPGSANLAVSLGHDAAVAVSVAGEVVLVLELERLFDERYFHSSFAPAICRRQFEFARRAIAAATRVERFEQCALVGCFDCIDAQRDAVQHVFECGSWTRVPHHEAHAEMGFADAGYSSALVFSVDGGGDDGTFHIFRGDAGSRPLTHLAERDENFGYTYRLLAHMTPEVHGARFQAARKSDRLLLSLPGKFMGYSALGRVREAWIPALSALLMRANRDIKVVDSTAHLAAAWNLTLGADGFMSPRDARDMAATAQEAFSRIMVGLVLDQVAALAEPVECVVLVGGCALNVLTNQRIRDALRAHGIAVHVPSAPSDPGLVVGGLARLEPLRKHELAFLGLPILDARSLPGLIRSRGARRVRDVGEIADLLIRGEVVGVIQGRQEVGPRALGHRSLLMYPAAGNRAKERLNKIKGREWYRPVCPVVPQANATLFFFDDDVVSPYMSFAPQVRPEIRERFPDMAHYDGTARVQTVPDDGSWFRRLLAAIDARTGFPVLLNTSFNTKGRPLTNSATRALADTDIPYVLIEDYLFDSSKTADVKDEL